MKQVSCFRYLGVHLMDDLSNEQHIIKRRTAAYTALNKAKNLGFASPDTDIEFKSKMFKINIRPALMYGIEACRLSFKDTKKLKSIE